MIIRLKFSMKHSFVKLFNQAFTFGFAEIYLNIFSLFEFGKLKKVSIQIDEQIS